MQNFRSIIKQRAAYLFVGFFAGFVGLVLGAERWWHSHFMLGFWLDAGCAVLLLYAAAMLTLQTRRFLRAIDAAENEIKINLQDASK